MQEHSIRYRLLQAIKESENSRGAIVTIETHFPYYKIYDLIRDITLKRGEMFEHVHYRDEPENSMRYWAWTAGRKDNNWRVLVVRTQKEKR